MSPRHPPCETPSDMLLVSCRISDSSLLARWYAESNPGPASVANTESAEAKLQRLDLTQTRRLLGLDRYPVDSVYAAFARATDDEGHLSRQEFGSVFAKFTESSNV